MEMSGKKHLSDEKGLDCDCLKLSEFFTMAPTPAVQELKITLISNGYEIGMTIADYFGE